MSRPRLLVPLAVIAVLVAGCAEKPADSLALKPPESIALLGPYVTGVTETSAKVLWVTAEGRGWALATRAEVSQANEDPSLHVDTQVAPIPGRGELLHTAMLSGLRPGQTYDYAITDGNARQAGSFRAALPKDTTQPFRFAVYGDNRSFPQRHAAVVKTLLSEMPLDFVVDTGDLVANGAAWPLWKKEFFGPAAAMLSRTAIWPVRGNHEGNGPLYPALFGLQPAAPYYSFDYGNVHIVAVDSGIDEKAADPEMLAWLEKDLAATKAEWKLVAYHRPTFDIRDSRATWGQKDLLPILERHGVDMVVNGHTHIYQRFVPIGPAGGKPIVHVTAGGGGAPSYPIFPSPILAKAYSGLHCCIFRVAGNRLEMKTLLPDGQLLDELTLVHTDGKFQKGVMDTALDTQTAKDIAYLFSGFWVNFAEPPKAGQAATALVMADNFPAGERVKFSAAPDCPWAVEEATFDFTYEPSEDADPNMLPKPFELKVRAPADFSGVTGSLQPPLETKVSITYKGEVYEYDHVSVGLTQAIRRKMMPEPEPAAVPRAAKAITIDGDLSEWKDVPFTAVPATKSPSKVLRLAWGPEGLYGALSVPDKGITVSLPDGLAGDRLELFVETDRARSFNAMRNENAMKCDLFPRLDRADGRPGIRIGYGRMKDNTDAAVKAAWRRTADGYALEFLLSAEALAPAKMEPGATVGFHYILYNDGQLVEQFAPVKRAACWRTPILWGAVRLADK